MLTADQSLLGLTARELMKHPVVRIPEGMSLAAAARLLQTEHISGAPVVNPEGRCVGVLSAGDFLRHAQETGAAPPRKAAHPEAVCSEWQVMDADLLPRDEVRQHMSLDVVSCALDEPIAAVARQMLDAHIHRVIVLDAHGRPVGVVSSTDIVAAVAAHHGDKKSW
jgi:CBS domain-containing protein